MGPWRLMLFVMMLVIPLSAQAQQTSCEESVKRLEAYAQVVAAQRAQVEQQLAIAMAELNKLRAEAQAKTPEAKEK